MKRLLSTQEGKVHYGKYLFATSNYLCSKILVDECEQQIELGNVINILRENCARVNDYSIENKLGLVVPIESPEMEIFALDFLREIYENRRR